MFVWKGKELNTFGDLGNAIYECQTKEDAKSFLDAYSAEDGEAVARANTGYIIGYYNAETRKRLYELFEVSHPVFGGSV